MQELGPSADPGDTQEREVDGTVPPRQSTLTRSVLALTVLTSGLSAGLFYSFEVAVTPGLATVSDHTYIEAFQGMNAIIRNAPFAVAFFGPIALAVAALALVRGNRGVTRLVAAGLVLYVAGVLAVTFGFHVPRNQQLATYGNLATTDLVAVRAWFEGPWNTMNLVRAAAACAAFTLFSLAALITPAGVVGSAGPDTLPGGGGGRLRVRGQD